MTDQAPKQAHGLLATTDAAIWAEEFCRIFAGKIVSLDPMNPDPHGPVDFSLMVGWFANAIETGRAAGRQELCPHEDTYAISDDLVFCRDCAKRIQ